MDVNEAKEYVNTRYKELLKKGHEPLQCINIILGEFFMMGFVVRSPLNNRPLVMIEEAPDGIMVYHNL